ncbi:MAG TPA: class I SAM-dependent methyltransferase [Kiritimatiellia bacterium]|nr:class I SAM-dependent methyltransferase [Kiritimatiellia bacterium]HMO99338.1 class I SAM-dependent methyltransferase [Kiritimatiellia bacterium]HMP96096.1 class I SAM-dependent methyltransferase [Kiritimatiellia bacterium]
MLTCRFCGTRLTRTFVNLGCSPIANEFIKAEALNHMEPFYPLHAYVCDHCHLVQIPPEQTPQNLFNAEYPYFSSFSDSWLAHAKKYTQMMITRFGLHPGHRVVEVASNDGYLLQYFKEVGFPVLGIEPANNCAEAAIAKGIPTEIRFFGNLTARALATEHAADVMVANNVLAHVPDINDFVEGFRILLKPEGIATFEFPHLLNLIQRNEFDTIYHEHYSYLSLHATRQVFAAHDLTIFDVEELPSHGGSLRLFVRHAANGKLAITPNVARVLDKEDQAGLTRIDGYLGFEPKVQKVKRELLKFLITAKEEGKRVVGYGAPAKGNTLLNYCGVRTDLLDFTVDRSPYKQGKFLPGTHIPIYGPEKIAEVRPDYLLILPWNLQREIVEQMKSVRDWGCRFVIPIPELKVLA